MGSLLSVAAAAALLAAPAARELPFAQGWELRGDAARVSEDGRDAVAIGTGRAFRRDVLLADGTIELDVKVTRRRSFVYVTFRMENDDEYEDFYLRPHKSGLPDAVQYAPVRQGRSAWQLHHGPGATAALVFEPDTWTRLRLVLNGPTAAVYLGDVKSGAAPSFVARLDREPRAGYLGLRASSPGAKSPGPVAWFSSVRVLPDAPALDPKLVPPAPADPPGVVRAWAVSEALTHVARVPLRPPAGQGFRTVKAEAGGLVSLLRHVKIPPEAESWTTAARLHLRADTAGPRRLDLGFSDAATVYLRHAALARRRGVLLREPPPGRPRPPGPGVAVPAARGRRQRAPRRGQRRLWRLGLDGPLPRHGGAAAGRPLTGRRRPQRARCDDSAHL